MTFVKTTGFLITTALATTAWAAQDVSLYDVEVRAELNDFADSNALTYWPDLEADLQKAIIERVNLSGDDADPRVEVEISKVSVDGDTYLPDSGEFNQLEGVVKVYEGESPVTVQGQVNAEVDNPISTYPLRLSAQAGDTAAPEGFVVIPPSQDDFYTAMVQAFAETVVEDIDK